MEWNIKYSMEYGKHGMEYRKHGMEYRKYLIDVNNLLYKNKEMK